MLVIPAIDLKGGRCVRLWQGRADQETVYADDPVAIAERWRAAGATLLHIVDLDGAFQGRPMHLEVVQAIAEQVSVPIQYGGGVRNEGDLRAAMAAGASRVMLGTVAAEDPAFLHRALQICPEGIVAAVDVRAGQVATRGWVELSGTEPVELGKRLHGWGVRRALVTDAGRDGTMSGPNLELLQSVTETGLQVIAAGGISSLADIVTLARLDLDLEGAVVGRALYNGAVDLAKAIRLVQLGG